MARKKTKKPPMPAWKRRLIRISSVLLAASAAGLMLTMFITANVVHIRLATVKLSDLPPSMNGLKLLYITDFDLCGTHTAARAGRLLNQLQSLAPDVLLLGGDYTSASLLSRLNNRDATGDPAAMTALFSQLRDFDAPLGKFAIRGDNERDLAALQLSMYGSDVQLIENEAVTIDNGTDQLTLVGLSGAAPLNSLNDYTRTLSARQCVIALAHTPAQYVQIQISEAAEGGAWADLVLAGHTHGGQIKLGDRVALDLNEQEKRYLAGFYGEGGLPMLVSQGLGCEAVNLRLSSQAEVWLITLECKEAEPQTN